MSNYQYSLILLFFGLFNIVNGLEWYDGKVLYQIYPKSFSDSNGDGIGDLKGIASKAQYFKDIGVGAVWLSPIFQSPMVDNGYDISNYTNIAEMFGTLDDLKALIKAFHDQGVKVLLDLVPNHTSDEHPWFKDSVARKNGKDDYYVWVSPDKRKPGGEPEPPNNWLSVFGGSAWAYNKDRDQFYLHQFGSYQPDLNYTNPQVIEEMKNVMRYWMDMDVDGFRVDAVPHLVEDKDLISEVPVPGCTPVTSYDCLIHNRTKDQAGTYKVLEELGKVLKEDKYKGTPRKLFLEAYSSINNTMKYYSENNMPFNFNLLQMQRDWNATQVEKCIKEWVDAVPSGNSSVWVIGNHDNSRVASRMGEDMIDAMNMLVFMAPGNTVTYYGEEIGMVDAHLRGNEKNDTRDPERTPMQWNSDKNSGFSNATKTWLPVNPNYWKVNTNTENAAKKSHLTIYKNLIHLQDDIINELNYTTYIISPWVFAMSRPKHLLVINLDDRDQQVNLTTIDKLPSSLTVRISSLNSVVNEGDSVRVDKLILRPRSAIIFKTSSAVTNTISVLLMLLGLLILNF